MKKTVLIASILLLLAIGLVSFSSKKYSGVVSQNGDLSVQGVHLVNKNGDPVQFKGMSLFWSQWESEFYNRSVVKFVAREWKSGIIRAAMGVGKGGYLDEPSLEQGKIETIIKAAIKNDIYVIIDWHSHHAEDHPEEAKKFFGKMAKKYGKYPNVLYEIYNEPLCDWPTIKTYAQEVIKEIRKYDPDNVIIVGTPQWSQLVDQAAENPIEGKNICYTLHFYSATHKQELRDIAQKAIDLGACLFVTEFGTCTASGNGKLDFAETDIWMDFMDKNHISWCNWSLCDKKESASALLPDANTWGNWLDHQLTESGKYIRDKIKGEEN